jgi:hypothetical protein
VALAEQLTLARAALEDTPHAAPPLVRLQSVSEIPVGFEFVRGHGRQGAVPTTPPRRKVMRGGKDRCVSLKQGRRARLPFGGDPETLCAAACLGRNEGSTPLGVSP